MEMHSDPTRVVTSAMEELQAGKGSTYLLLGEGGIGKTHLLMNAFEKARAAGWQCLYAAAHEYDRDIAYATLRNLVGALDGNQVRPELRNATAQLQEALDAVVLADPMGLTAATGHSPRVLTTRLLRSLAVTAPVLVVIDDVHLADEDSLVALTLAARHLTGRRIMFLFASRTGPWRRGQALAATLGHLVSEDDGSVLELAPATGGALDELVHSLLDARPDDRLARYLTNRTRGNALLVRETINALRAAGAIRVEQGTCYLLDDSPPLFSRRDALLYQVFAGSRLDRELARMVSVFGRVDLDYLPLLSELAHRPPEEVRTAFDALVTSGSLASRGSGWYEFSHPLIGELLYDEVGPAERRHVHAAIAAYVKDHPGLVRMSALEQARHLSEGATRGDIEAITVALRTGDQTVRVSPLTAARWYQRALDLLPETDPSTAETLSRQALAYWKGSRPTLALESGSKVLAFVGSGSLHDRTVATMVNCHNAMGKLQSAADLLAVELDRVQDPAPFWAQLAAMQARLGDTPRARELADWSWARVRSSAPGDQVIAYTYLGQTASSIGTFDELTAAVDQLERLGANELELPVGARTSALESAAHISALAGATGRARELLKLAHAAARLAGFQDIGGQAGLAGALVELAAGEWTAATASIAREAVHLEFSGLGSNLARLRTAEVQILAGRGEFRRATELLETIVPPVTRKIDYAIWQVTGAWLDVETGRLDAALPLLKEVLDEAAAQGWSEVITLAYAALVEGHLSCGDAESSRKLATEFSAHAAVTRMPRDQWAAGLAYALAHGDGSRAKQVLVSAGAQGAGFMVAQAQHILGSVGQDAATQLSASWAGFRAMDATVWTKRVEGTARSRGIMLDRPTTSATPAGPLTEVERQLASLVADGLGNRQIAEVMSYSTKTIEAYLTRLYRKTGYSSRIELIVAHERGHIDMA